MLLEKITVELIPTRSHCTTFYRPILMLGVMMAGLQSMVTGRSEGFLKTKSCQDKSTIWVEFRYFGLRNLVDILSAFIFVQMQRALGWCHFIEKAAVSMGSPVFSGPNASRCFNALQNSIVISVSPHYLISVV
ncbi:unnamed protein product [Kuraishia capsulata CBS 1993]|uniref:Uncharacterized protein n=1 Tax=Kuraishia capsulata CBS 1993 TaxID=1382522 RepID=W6MH77_9ASCO|nr:uncharacterized protein KUCA_T00001274001 [Kuraishia capsulata CBS 1993]CDK25306.1 unnamed protein product [Kuraishia capsulata CBS 1993]